MCIVGQRVSVTITGPGPSFFHTKGLFRAEAIITILNHDLVIMIMTCVYIYMTSERFELESP